MIGGVKERYKKQTTRSAINGVLMTTIDIVLFVTFGSLFKLPPVLVNIGSTSLTSLVSYQVNKHWVFSGAREDMSDRRMLTAFMAVTFIGVFVIQNIIIFFVTHEGWGIGGWLRDLIAGWGLGDFSIGAVTLALAKLSAVMVAGAWHFFGYKFVVFKAGTRQAE